MKTCRIDRTKNRIERETKDGGILKRSFDPKQAMFLNKKCSGRRNKKRGIK